jgi:hypothetical protein
VPIYLRARLDPGSALLGAAHPHGRHLGSRFFLLWSALLIPSPFQCDPSCFSRHSRPADPTSFSRSRHITFARITPPARFYEQRFATIRLSGIQLKAGLLMNARTSLPVAAPAQPAYSRLRPSSGGLGGLWKSQFETSTRPFTPRNNGLDKRWRSWRSPPTTSLPAGPDPRTCAPSNWPNGFDEVR